MTDPRAMSASVPMTPSHKRDMPLRWIVLAIASLAPVGAYYAYDNPSALNTQLREAFVGEGRLSPQQFEYDFNMLYTLYSLPNVIVPLIFGLLVDKIGVRTVMLALGVFLLAGQAVFALGVQVRSVPLLFIGRLLFGFGGESTIVAQTAFISSWFGGKELAFAMAVQLSVSRIGSVLNDVLAPWLAHTFSVAGACWGGFIMVVVAVVFSCLLIAMDMYADRKLIREGHEPEMVSEEVVDMKSFSKFSHAFWVLAGVSVLLYTSMLPFNNVASAVFIQNQYNGLPLAQAQVLAGRAMSFLFVLPVFLGPLAGAALDKLERPVAFMMAASVATLAGHTVALSASPVLAMCLFGIGYTLFATAVWPAIPLAVQPNLLGTAYGIATALQNLGMAIMPLLVAFLRARTGSYVAVELVFGCLAVASFAVAAYLHVHATRLKHPLVLGSAAAPIGSDSKEGIPLLAAKLMMQA